ncbi:SID1 transmembrane family member 1 [Amphibalanus amphitrite]|uniref:SID1 transmembrane family member 1 n=2 Tax=Amphibalanus amphitrite TaxID=1232801 RepID=A0A6A4VJ08_AMPAM|nr:SID1 transmembrane family member 1 [Amphibalanus amphitrite]
MDGNTSVNEMMVFASRFNYSLNLQAIKVMIRGNIGKPSPSAEDPLVVSVRNWAGGHTISVPYLTYDRHGQMLAIQDHATRYLCPAEPGQPEHAIVSVGTGHLPASQSFHFQVTFQRIGHWSLTLDAPEKLLIEPPDPGLFAFRWPAKGPPQLLLKVDTVQMPQVCTTVALQPRVCPLAQTEAELVTASTFFTMSSAGELVVDRKQFPDGFYLLLLPHVNDVLCDPHAPPLTNITRKKTVMVTLTEHQLPVSLLAAPIVLAVLLLVAGAASACLLRRDLTAPRLDLEPDAETERPRGGSLTLSEDLLLDGQMEEEPTLQVQEALPARSPVSLLMAAGLLLLALGGEAALTAFRLLRRSGDLDVCYRNELCSLTSAGVPGLNHVVARLPYIGAGLGLLICLRVQRTIYRRVTIDGTIKIGAPHEWSLLEAAALALVAQGLLSALQSTCPGPTNAPLDAAFIYFALTAMACKLFQTRRGVWAAGHYAPLLLTGALVLAELVEQRAGHEWYVWVVLGLLHMLATVVIGVQLYVLGEISADPGALRRVWDKSHLPRESPNFQINRAAFALVMLVNLSLVIGAGVSKMAELSHYAMLFFAIHAVLFALYYLLLKLVKSEESAGRVSLLLLAMGLLLLVSGVATLVGWSTMSTGSTPAVSRLMSRPCLPHSLFDTHDLWHLLTAPALLCLALALILLDDNLLLTPRLEITRF